MDERVGAVPPGDGRRAVVSFYDRLAPYYHVLFADWDASMARQGDAIAFLLVNEGPPKGSERFRVLDVAAGVGTQALPLAARGYPVQARDLSSSAIARLRAEAEARGLSVDAEVADMRGLSPDDFDGPFDAVLVLDNSIAHLSSEEEMLEVFRGLGALLGPKGVLICSVRDFENVDRTDSTHHYPEVEVEGLRYRARQEWSWRDADSYDSVMVVEQRSRTQWVERVRTSSAFRVVTPRRLMALFIAAGFTDCQHFHGPFYQPLVLGVRATSG